MADLAKGRWRNTLRSLLMNMISKRPGGWCSSIENRILLELQQHFVALVELINFGLQLFSHPGFSNSCSQVRSEVKGRIIGTGVGYVFRRGARLPSCLHSHAACPARHYRWHSLGRYYTCNTIGPSDHSPYPPSCPSFRCTQPAHLGATDMFVRCSYK